MLIRLTGKTRKGKNRLHEAGTTQWCIVTRPQEVAFASGLWFSIVPTDEWGNEPEDWIENRHTRWVEFPIDRDFSYIVSEVVGDFWDEDELM